VDHAVDETCHRAAHRERDSLLRSNVRAANAATPGGAPTLVVGWYWHFVDVVWLTVFFSLYLWPRLR